MQGKWRGGFGARHSWPLGAQMSRAAANASLACLDDRIDEPVLGTPGGELGEFTTALAAYLREKDGPESSPSQEVVRKPKDATGGVARGKTGVRVSGVAAHVMSRLLLLLLLAQVTRTTQFRPAALVKKERYVPPIQHQSACNLCVDYKRVHVSPFQSGTVVQTAASWLNFTSRLRTILGSLPRLGSPLDLEGSLEICGTGWYQWRIVLGIWLAWAVDGAEDVLLKGMASELVQNLHTDEINIVDLCLFSHIAMACAAFLSGSLADSFGRRHIHCASSIVTLIFSSLSVLAPDFWFFGLCRICAGLGLGALVGTDIAVLLEFLPVSKRDSYISLLFAGYAAGKAYGDLCMHVPLFLNSWRLPFLLCSLPLVPSIFLRLQTHETPYALVAQGSIGQAKEVLGQVAKANQISRSIPWIPGGSKVKQYQGMDFRDCLSSGIWATMQENHLEKVIGLACLIMLMDFGSLLMPLVPEIASHLDVEESFSYCVLGGLVSTVISCCLGFVFLRRVPAWDVLIPGCFLCAGALMGMSYLWQSQPGEPKIFALLMSLWGFGLGSTFGPFYAIAVRIAPANARASSLGVVVAVSRSAVAFQPFLAADLLSLLGTSLSAALVSSLWLGAACLATFLRVVMEVPQETTVETSKA
ncbi:unnamed protein product [Effrenium voratum]|nr:unnamed protein product [Effrenium voratum]